MGCGTNYEIECKLCPDGRKQVYIGESSQNLYTISLEHMSRYRGGKFKHQNTEHQGEVAMYRAKVTANTRDYV